MAKTKQFGNLKTGEENLKGGLSNLFPKTNISTLKQDKVEPQKEVTYTRKTFLIEEKDFDYIKSFVKFMRMKGQTNYTQKEALTAALSLLKENYPDSVN